MKFQHSACLIPALFQTAMMILFAAWSCIPETVLEFDEEPMTNNVRDVREEVEDLNDGE